MTHCCPRLQDDDAAEESDMEESCADGFVVPDGYMSEDEGFQDAEELGPELEGAASL